MEIVCAFIGVCLASFFIGFVFGSLSQNKEIDHKDLTIAEYMGENRRLRDHCDALEEQLGLLK